MIRSHMGSHCSQVQEVVCRKLELGSVFHTWLLFLASFVWQFLASVSYFSRKSRAFGPCRAVKLTCSLAKFPKEVGFDNQWQCGLCVKDKIKSAAASCFYHSPEEVQSESVDPLAHRFSFCSKNSGCMLQMLPCWTALRESVVEELVKFDIPSPKADAAFFQSRWQGGREREKSTLNTKWIGRSNLPTHWLSPRTIMDSMWEIVSTGGLLRWNPCQSP